MILILELRKNQSTIDYKISTIDLDQKIIIRVRQLFHGGDFTRPGTVSRMCKPTR